MRRKEHREGKCGLVNWVRGRKETNGEIKLCSSRQTILHIYISVGACAVVARVTSVNLLDYTATGSFFVTKNLRVETD